MTATDEPNLMQPIVRDVKVTAGVRYRPHMELLHLKCTSLQVTIMNNEKRGLKNCKVSRKQFIPSHVICLRKILDPRSYEENTRINTMAEGSAIILKRCEKIVMVLPGVLEAICKIIIHIKKKFRLQINWDFKKIYIYIKKIYITPFLILSHNILSISIRYKTSIFFWRYCGTSHIYLLLF
jgi:hypothetical protein